MADQDFDPHKERVVEAPVSNLGTRLHFLKCTIGTGILAMPKAFEFTGLILGSIATFVTGVVCTYAINLVIKTEYLLCKRKQVAYMDYSEAMVYAVENGPTKLRCLAKTLGVLVNLFNCALQLGICCVYIIFVSKNVKTVVDDYHCDYLPLRVYMCIFLVLFILINFVPNLKLFAPLSGFANFLMVIGLGIVLYFVFLNFPPNMSKTTMAGDPTKWVMFIGICLFAMVTVGVVCSAESTMANPKAFGGWFGIWSTSMMMVTVLYWFVGLVGYLAFGSDVQGSLTLNLPQKVIISEVTQIIFAACLAISYGLQCFPAVEIIWMNYMLPHLENASKVKQMFVQYILRTLLVLLTFSLGMGFAEYLANAISFVGVVCVSMLAFAFPGLMHLCLRWPDSYGKFKWILVKDILLIVLGFFVLISGTFVSIMDIVNSSPDSTACHDNIIKKPENTTIEPDKVTEKFMNLL